MSKNKNNKNKVNKSSSTRAKEGTKNFPTNESFDISLYKTIAELKAVNTSKLTAGRKSAITRKLNNLKNKTSDAKNIDSKKVDNKKVDNKKADNKKVDNKKVDNKKVDNKKVDNKKVDNKKIEVAAIATKVKEDKVVEKKVDQPTQKKNKEKKKYSFTHLFQDQNKKQTTVPSATLSKTSRKSFTIKNHQAYFSRKNIRRSNMINNTAQNNKVNTAVAAAITPPQKRQTPEQLQKIEKKKNFRNKLWGFTAGFMAFIMIATVFVTYFVYQYYIDVQESMPSLSLHTLENKMKNNTEIYDKNDEYVADLAEESYVAVTHPELPQVLIDAITSAEDARFFRHNGIDGPRTVEAVLRNLVADDITGGGSTITQQLIKVTTLKDKIAKEGNEYKNSNERKVHEWIHSYQLEHEMSKEEIMTAYFNTLGYGRFVGVGTAAKRFFNKNISELTLPEAILLAGIPQASTDNNPYINMDTAKERFDTVTNLMMRHGHITEDEANAIKSIPLSDLLLTDQENFTAKNHNYFSAVENELYKIFNIPDVEEESLDPLPFYTGYKIYTAMDTEQQAYANMIMDTENVVPYSQMLANVGIYEENLNLQASFAVVDVQTGAVPAIGPGRQFSQHGFNYAIKGYRSPGSAIKPVIDYAPGMELMGWTPWTVMKDSKTYYTGTLSEVYNFGRSVSEKNVSLQQAVAQSLNTTAVQAIQAVGVDYAGTFANNLGISTAGENLAKGELYESAALGGGIETTPLELAGSYAAFGNSGQYNEPFFIRKIENDRGEIIYEHRSENTQVMSQQTAQYMTDVLRYTTHTGTPASWDRAKVDYDIPFASKTGTSSYDSSEGVSTWAEKDHWIVGYSPEYSIAVWTGFNIENSEFLARTGGNTNANKSYGSYIMAAWMNQFAPRWTEYQNWKEFNPKATLQSLAVTHNEDTFEIDWKAPKISYPTYMDQPTKDSLGHVVYDIYMVDEKENETLLEENVPSDQAVYNYKSLIKDKNFTIKIVARLSGNNFDLSQSSEITVDVIVVPEEKDKDKTEKNEKSKDNE